MHAPALRRALEATHPPSPQPSCDGAECDGAGARDGSGGGLCNGAGAAERREYEREAPPPAAATLALLRAIATHGSTTNEGNRCDGWPATSTARSRVIRGYDLKPARSKAADGEAGSGIGTGDSSHGGRPNDDSTSNQTCGSRSNCTNGKGSRPHGGSSTGNPGGKGSRPNDGCTGNPGNGSRPTHGTNGNGGRPNNGGSTSNPANRPTKGGSMTVVNTALVDPALIPVPRANALFPEMATSVFKLEIWLIKEYGRLCRRALALARTPTLTPTLT